MSISIIFPTYNEEATIASTIQIIRERAARTRRLQIIVAGGRSDVRTVTEVRKEDTDRFCISRHRLLYEPGSHSRGCRHYTKN